MSHKAYYLHSARTRSLSLTKSAKVSFVRTVTSEAETKAAALRRPVAKAVKERMSNLDGAVVLVGVFWRTRFCF